MTMVLSVAAKNAALDAVVALMELGTTLPGVRFHLLTSPSTFLSFVDLPLPAWGPASNGQKDLLATAIVAVSTGGTPNQWLLQDRDLAVTIEGRIGTSVGNPGSGTELQVSPANVAMVAGQSYRLTRLTLAFT